MAERRSIRLDDTNVIAAAQIAGWLAFPNRPQHGIQIVQQWWIRRALARGETAETLPIKLEKKNRLQQRIYTLDNNLRRTLRAGDWLARRTIKESGGDRIIQGLAKGVRRLARDESRVIKGAPVASEPNMIRSYWTANLPVLHLAKSSLFAIIETYQAEGRDGWHLERTLFQPDWVDAAIAGSENTAIWADKLGIIPIEKAIRFHRD